MIFSVFDHANLCYKYFQGAGVTPPHGWFRKASPGRLKQPEEIAAQLPSDAVFTGTGKLPKGVIATDMPGIGTKDNSGAVDGRGAGLGALGAWNRTPSFRPRNISGPVELDAWDSADSRGNTER